MEPAAIFLLLIVLAFIVLFVTRPFFERRRVRAAENSHELSFLLAERERLLTGLQELDFDQTLGKIPAEDYPAQRAELLQKGAEVLRQLDTLTPGVARQTGGKVPRPGSAPKPTAPLSDDDLEDLLAKRRNGRKDKTAGFCPKCGKPVLQSDVFCPSCGSTWK
ncbi:MAG: zinc-ribbon domain-containing protein [Candidatus Atribacteria bacterium]|nr:zinc-ribbon domain-containing protein [Candidatus Atribacteria bacterium]